MVLLKQESQTAGGETMLEIITRDAETMQMVIMAAASLPMVMIGNWISKKVPDHTGESEAEK